MLKIGESAMRYRPINVPSRSLTAITILALTPMGRRICARVVFAVAIALVISCATSEAVKPPIGPFVSGIKSPSGGTPGLASGPTLKNAGLDGPGVTPLGAEV